MAEKHITKQELLGDIDTAHRNLMEFISRLSPKQLTMTDHVGWTVKDHLMHLADWAENMDALLQKQPRHEAMGVTETQWMTGDYDAMNETLRQKHLKATPLDVIMALQTAINRVRARLELVDDDDLQQPYGVFQPHDHRPYPVIHSVYHNTVEHYA